VHFFNETSKCSILLRLSEQGTGDLKVRHPRCFRIIMIQDNSIYIYTYIYIYCQLTQLIT